MASQITACPNCGSTMQPKLIGDIDKVMVCPSCGTTIDVADNMKRVKVRRTEKKGGLFGGREVVEEHIHEYRSDAAHPHDAAFGTAGFPPPPGTAAPQQPVTINLGDLIKQAQSARPVVVATPTVKTAGCGITIVILLFIGLITAASIGVAFYLEEGELPFGLGHSIEEISASRTLTGHDTSVDFVAYHPTGAQIASFGSGEVWVWDVESGAPLYKAPSAGPPVYSPDGQYLLSPKDKQVVVLDAATGATVRTIEMQTSEYYSWYRVAISPDGRKVATSSNTTVYLFDFQSGDLLQALPGELYAQRLLFSPDGISLAAADWQTIALWDTAEGSQLIFETVEAGTSTESLIFSPDSKQLLLANSDTVEFFDIANGSLKRAKTITIDDPDSITTSIQSIAYSPDGKYLALGDFFSKVTVWNLDKGRIDYRLKSEDGLNWVAFSPGGGTIVGGGYENIFFWKIGDEKSTPAREAQPQPEKAPTHTPGGAPANNLTAPTPTSFSNLLAPTVTVTPSTTPSLTCLATPRNNVPVNVRQTPSTAAPILRKMESGVSLDGQTIGRDGFTWYRIAEEGGWVREDVITAAPNCQTLPAVEG